MEIKKWKSFEKKKFLEGSALTLLKAIQMVKKKKVILTFIKSHSLIT